MIYRGKIGNIACHAAEYPLLKGPVSLHSSMTSPPPDRRIPVRHKANHPLQSFAEPAKQSHLPSTYSSALFSDHGLEYRHGSSQNYMPPLRRRTWQEKGMPDGVLPWLKGLLPWGLVLEGWRSYAMVDAWGHLPSIFGEGLGRQSGNRKLSFPGGLGCSGLRWVFW